MSEMQAFRLAEAPWADRVNPVNGAPYLVARLVKDAETGMEAMLVRYPAGSFSPQHSHPCAHGLLVITGRLRTQAGEFGPGDLVWYPEGCLGLHGATADEAVTVLLFTNKPFAVTYTSHVTG